MKSCRVGTTIGQVPKGETMKSKIKSSILGGVAAMMLVAASPASAQDWRYHPGWHRYHVYRNHAWGYVWHPVGWTVPPAWVGPVVVTGPSVTLGWGYHPGWHRYHVYRNGHWGYVYHPAGWSVPSAWAGPRYAHGYVSHGYVSHGYAHGFATHGHSYISHGNGYSGHGNGSFHHHD